jgi:hypothetical protein
MARIDNIFKTEIKKGETHPKRITKWIHYTKLKGNRKQYRNGTSKEDKERTKKRVEQLADLIELDGEILQELLVRKTDTDEYEIIAGHHRYLACKLLVEERGEKQYEFLPCVIRNVSDARSEFSVYSSNGYDNKTDYEIMHELERMKYLLNNYPEEFPEVQSGRMVERLARLLNMKKTNVGEYLTISKNLGDKGMEKFQSGELKKSAAIQIATLPEEEQEKIIEAGKTSIHEVKAYKQAKELRMKNQSAKEKAQHEDEEEKQELPGQYIIADVDCNMEESKNVPESGTLPELKNMNEREEFVNTYQNWSVWCRNEFTEETFYRYELPDGSAIVVKEYPYSSYWDTKQEWIGTQLYLVRPDTKFFKDAETNMTMIKEHLKKLGRG